MKTKDDPLEYPPHYPPADRWKKFFIGVRWLGPDLAFFKELKSQQAARSLDSQLRWKSERQRHIAEVLGKAFKKQIEWPTPYFLPYDRLEVIAGGPQFDGDCYAFEAALFDAGKELGIDLSEDSWRVTKVNTLGEMIDEIIKLQDQQQCDTPNHRSPLAPVVGGR